ncbi:Cell division protein FtsQ [Lutibaculum baratangense AMV1]|uniref:Cell division protein FtsQ n=1 Tax=Lutibaculum baratangense AMV1 TaxID=631454 RepID=V4R5U5_9HYPH|nr:Cell division protein FtsQ [Lutibaculum baratangense AMV1]
MARSFVELHLPRRAGLMATGAFFAATTAYGIVLGDHIQSFREGAVRATAEVAAVTGLGVHSIQITGADETSEDEIVQALDLASSPSILTFDPFLARQRLMELPWVEEATVQKLYPNTLRIDVKEREAFALWQIGGIVSIVGRDGGAIEELTEPRFASLPLLVGYGANRGAADLMDIVRAHPRVAARFRAAVRVADRRWNVRLDNGVEVKLPEVDAAGAVAELAELDRDEALLSRDLVAVDLRLPDRIILKLSEQAAMQRKASFEGRNGRKNKGKSI